MFLNFRSTAQRGRRAALDTVDRTSNKVICPWPERTPQKSNRVFAPPITGYVFLNYHVSKKNIYILGVTFKRKSRISHRTWTQLAGPMLAHRACLPCKSQKLPFAPLNGRRKRPGVLVHASLPLAQLAADATLPVLKVGLMASAGALCARHVSCLLPIPR